MVRVWSVLGVVFLLGSFEVDGTLVFGVEDEGVGVDVRGRLGVGVGFGVGVGAGGVEQFGGVPIWPAGQVGDTIVYVLAILATVWPRTKDWLKLNTALPVLLARTVNLINGASVNPLEYP